MLVTMTFSIQFAKGLVNIPKPSKVIDVVVATFKYAIDSTTYIRM